MKSVERSGDKGFPPVPTFGPLLAGAPCSLLEHCYSHSLGPKRNIDRELYFFTYDINARDSQASHLIEVKKVIALRRGM